MCPATSWLSSYNGVMPELPEVETIRMGLGRLLLGLRVNNVSYDWPKAFPNTETDVNKFLIGATIINIRRRGKVIIIGLDTRYSILVHLKMTGQLVYVENSKVRFGAGHPSDSLVGSLPDKTTRVIFEFDKAKLFFNDQRKFGWVRLVPTTQIPEIDFFKKLGPEPLASDFTPAIFSARLDLRKGSSIKAALLDQTVLAGVGNIYADESLFDAKIHPSTKVGDLTVSKRRQLFKGLINVLNVSIEKGGSTDKNYVNATGKKGSYIDFAKVFRREGQPCLVCGATIIKTKVAGRGTHTCPVCQPDPR